MVHVLALYVGRKCVLHAWVYQWDMGSVAFLIVRKVLANVPLS